MNEIGGTFKWSEEQIKAYAAAFREGDAVKVDGEGWVEVKTHNAVWGEYLAVGDPDGAMLNAAGKGSCGAFLQSGESCVVVTPKDYEVQEGDKLVRLGKTVEQYGQSELTFGKVYEVVRWHEDGELVYKNDMTTALLASYLKEKDGAWGVIPRYKNVKEEEEMSEERECASGTFKWSHKQIQAYARAFCEGDAVKVSGEWYEVVRREVTGAHPGDVHAATAKVNPYNLNYRHDGDMYYEGVARGFLESWVDSPHEIVTPKDYEVQKGDKLVWLGDTSSSHSFGWMYTVHDLETGRLVYFNNKYISRLADSESLCGGEWGVIPRYENIKVEEEMNSECERSGNVGKFKKGDRVKVTGGSYKGSEGSVGQSDEVGGGLSYAVLFDDGRDRWFEEEFLESVEGVEKSAEQEAFDYLLSQDTSSTRRILKDEVAIWAKVHLEHKDYNDLRQTIEILEKLEKDE